MRLFDLGEDERVITETAAAFADKRLAPFALEWDASHHFPVGSTGSAAPLGSHAADIYAKFATTNADKDFSAIIEALRG
jgi:hypothetical protein